MQRTSSPRHVLAAIASATKATEQANGRIRVEGGRDLDGDDLTVVCKLEPSGVLVITLF